MKRPVLKTYLLHWINTHQGEWHKKVNLYLVGDQIEFSAESTGRALRALEEEGLIKVAYYDGRWAKNLAKYCAVDYQPKIQKVVLIDGKAVLV